MARAIHIFNPHKIDQPTCLGRRVPCGLRCPNQIEMTVLFTVLSAMVAATEDPSLRLETIDKLALEWATQLSCRLHKSQEGVEDAVLDGFQLYRKATPPASVTSVPTAHGGASGPHEGESSALKPKDDQSGLEEEEVELPHANVDEPLDPFGRLKKAFDAYPVEVSVNGETIEKLLEETGIRRKDTALAQRLQARADQCKATLRHDYALINGIIQRAESDFEETEILQIGHDRRTS